MPEQHLPVRSAIYQSKAFGMKLLYLLSLLIISSTVFACCAKQQEVTQEPIQNTDSMKLKIAVGQTVFTATLYDNATVTAFKARLPMTVTMTELNGNEKYYDLPNGLPTQAANPGTIQTGDLMLYGANTLVLFYTSFSTPYSYSRLGRIDNPSGLAAALGSGSVTVRFELE